VSRPGDAGFRGRLKDGRVHLMDGGMGTLIYERGIFVNVCYDELNLTEATLVEGIHREYVEAGARIVETNTFGANPVKLSSFGLEGRTEELNRAAVERARRGIAAAETAGRNGCRGRSDVVNGDEDVLGDDGDVHVLGAVGPLGIRIEPWGPTAEDEARGYFGRQVDGLLAGGVDGFILETFQDLRELGQALAAVRERCRLPVVAQVTIEEGGRTSYGTDVETVARTLEEWGADAVGLNCSVGPAEILDAIERMAAVTPLPLSAQPNAGLPRTVGDRKMYLASPEYMARYARRMVEAGARLIGGCCGTTPEHIRRIGEALRVPDPGTGSGAPVGEGGPGAATGRPGGPPPARGETTRSASTAVPAAGASGGGARVATGEVPTIRAPAGAEKDVGREPVPLGERSPLGRRLVEGGFVTAVELIPPGGWDPTPLLADARRVRLAGVDAVFVPDAPRGRARMAALPAAQLAARETGLEVVAQYACRDRNMLGMISDLMGAAASGVRNLLVVTGDLTPTGPYPDHTAVFDIDSIGLTNVLHHLNRGLDPGGHPVEPPTEFVIGVILNQGAADVERELRRFHWKVEAGAEFAVTRPVFDPGQLQSFLGRREGRIPPVVAGLWPLDSLRTAEFLDNEVPGVQVPASVLERMTEAEGRGPEAAREEGVRIAVEAAEALLPLIGGVVVASPRGRVEMALEVVRRVRRHAAAPGGVG
jgi:methionine synthase / methylenetetrahydrofolate reductase(NADPH)